MRMCLAGRGYRIEINELRKPLSMHLRITTPVRCEAFPRSEATLR
jgi:hypothetical protein